MQSQEAIPLSHVQDNDARQMVRDEVSDSTDALHSSTELIAALVWSKWQTVVTGWDGGLVDNDTDINKIDSPQYPRRTFDQEYDTALNEADHETACTRSQRKLTPGTCII